jgi:hypothetical protein
MNIIKRSRCAAWSCFGAMVDAIMERGLGVYSYPPPSRGADRRVFGQVKEDTR